MVPKRPRSYVVPEGYTAEKPFIVNIIICLFYFPLYVVVKAKKIIFCNIVFDILSILRCIRT